MNQEIIDWYIEHRYEPQKVIHIGKTRHGLSQAQIEAAMEHCYHKIINGKPICKIEIARYVFAVARDIDDSKYAKKLQAYKNSENTICRLESKIKKAEEFYQSILIEKQEAFENAYAIGVVVCLVINLLFLISINLG